MSTAALVAAGVAFAGALIAFVVLPRRDRSEADVVELAPGLEAIAA